VSGAGGGVGGIGIRFRLSPERLKELTLLGIIVVTLLVFNLLVDDYTSGRFFNRVTTSVAITALLAVAQTLVILTRNIDLSVGSIVGVTAYVTGEFVADHPTATPVLAVGLAVGIGCGLGLVNGLLVAYGKVPAIIVTLGTLAIYRSWLIGHADAKSITADSLPAWVIEFPRRTVVSVGDLQLRWVFALALGVVVVLQLALSRLRWGRRLYAIGSNPEAAVQAGLPQRRLVLGAFAGCGALSGLAGFLFLARFGTITVTAGQGLELDSVGAAVVGGVSILGGAGTLVGALLGAVLIDLLGQSLVRTDQVSEFWRDAILGVLILAAVIGDVAIARRFRRRWARAAEATTRATPPSVTEPAPEPEPTAEVADA
jgi:rhamnose transport system permease protein